MHSFYPMSKAKDLLKRRKRKHGPIGAAPGSIVTSADALQPRIQVFSYNQSDFQEKEFDDIVLVFDYLDQHRQYIHWVQVKGFGNGDILRDIGDKCDIEPLVLEDISDSNQRPKYDEYNGHIFAISRIIFFDQQKQIVNTQFSVYARQNLVISFQETYDEYFEGLKKRLKTARASFREYGTGYLFYALLDTIYDTYFALLDQLQDGLENLEAAINEKPRKSNMYEVQHIKRILILMHRSVGPERDKMNEILRSTDAIFTEKDKMFFHDAYDHCIDIIETINSQKELATNLTDIYLSTVNNQMNDVMRILTIVSSIFIPLSFIAGLYGMNFAHQDPDTGRILKYNMPELYTPHGYIVTIGVMALIVIVQLFIFWRKGWFDKMK